MRQSRPLLLAFLALTTTCCERSQVVSAFPDEFVGVGLELRIEGQHPTVVRTFPGGSAHEAGLEPGDKLVMIDGRPVTGLSLGDVVMRIRGQPGTQVTLSVERDGGRIIAVLKRKRLAKTGEDYRGTESR